MNKFSKVLLYYFIYLQLSTSFGLRNDDPPGCPTSFEPVIFGNITQQNSIGSLPVPTIGAKINLGWTFLNQTAFRMSLEITNNCGWIGVLLGGANMKKHDVIVGQIILNNVTNALSLNVEDRYANQTGYPPIDPEFGGFNNTVLVGYKITQNSTLFVFDRLFNTNDTYDYVLTPGQDLTVSFAFGSSMEIDYHGSNVYSTIFPFENDFNGEGKRPFYKSFHYWTNFVCWGFVIDIAILIARFYQTKQTYMDWHGALMFLAIAVSLGCDFNIINANNIITQFSTLEGQVKWHVGIGLAFISLIILQLLGGAFLKYKITGSNPVENIVLMRKFHAIVGGFIYIFGKANVAIGVYMEYDEGAIGINYPIGLFIIYGFFLILRIVLEILYANQSHILIYLNFDQPKEKYDLSVTHDNSDINSALIKQQNRNEELISMINSDASDFEIQQSFPQIHYVILNDGIYDVSDLAHPGGEFIIQRVVGRQIGRFIYGAYGLESTSMVGHNHSVYTIDFLHKNFIGILYPISIFHTTNKSNDNLNQFSETVKPNTAMGSIDSVMSDHDAYAISRQFNLWTLHEKQTFNFNTSLFLFSNNDQSQNSHDSGVRVASFLSGVRWFGRHFVVQDEAGNIPARFYTVVLSITPHWVTARAHLLDYVFKENQITDKESFRIPQFTKVLPLLIKNYVGTRGMSRQIHNAQEGEQNFKILGPFGRGLQLRAKSEGLHVIVCGGTGIFPFIDLLNFLLLKSIYQVSISQGIKINWANFNISEEELRENLAPTFRLRLLAAFNSQEDIEGMDSLLLGLNRINQEFNLNLFDCVFRFPNQEKVDRVQTVTSQFSLDFFEKHLGLVQEIQRVWICGPPAMNRNVMSQLSKMGLSDDQIHLV